MKLLKQKFLIFLLVFFASFYGCEGAVPADLDRAAKVIRFMSEQKKLEKTDQAFQIF